MPKTINPKSPDAENTDINSELEKLRAENEALLSLNDDLQNKLESASSGIAKLKLPTLKLGDKVYEIKSTSINYKGNIYTAADIQADAELAQSLLDIGSKILSELKN